MSKASVKLFSSYDSGKPEHEVEGWNRQYAFPWIKEKDCFYFVIA